MTEIKDKLEQLKKEREARSKSQIIKQAWEKIDKDESISVKEKLDRLINLTREEKPTKPKSIPFEPIHREPVQLFENPYPLDTRYGRIDLASGLEIKGEILSCLSKEKAFKNLDLSTALFIDLETTGLSGGAGVVPFLVGLGYYGDDKFWVTQFFLGDLAEEEGMIHELARFFSLMDFQSVVTFNGKGFDIPLLETRFILQRQPFSLSSLPHLDFLYSARSLWSHKYESCRLFYLAREIVQADRSEDIPSAEVPWRYFQYLKTGNFALMEPVLYHNQEDILSLLGVVTIGSLVFSEDREEELVDAMDLYGAGRIMENIGEREKSAQFYKKALDGKLSDEILLTAKRKLSHYFKKKSDWKKAVSLWNDIASSPDVSTTQLHSIRELAMYFEHRMKEYEQARKVAEEGLALSQGVSSCYERDFAYRLERLKRKILRQKNKQNKKKISSS
ncbi:MAG: ribonuclease H-like domain-containing protein [Candidatus Aminicenantes bacterium]